ncbi:hypothetical protein M0R45_027713 [Rubus argutus]|uniref:Uncharacterized protein n=1 Tax=Rubus argutus TaxID=59490 RepID=A0AAW1X2D8_RUBAR
MSNGNFKFLPFTDISQARMNDLCSMMCSLPVFGDTIMRFTNDTNLVSKYLLECNNNVQVVMGIIVVYLDMAKYLS